MHRITTTRGASVEHPEISFPFAADPSPAQAAVVARWTRMLEDDIVAGTKRCKEGDEIVVGGWTLTLHALPDGTLEGRPAGSETVDAVAQRIAEQLAVAEAYGLAAEVDFPTAFSGVYVCPRYGSEGRFRMARTRPEHDAESGWVLRCDSVCGQGHVITDRKGRHIADEDWKLIRVSELALARPGVSRFLALPVGIVVELGFRGVEVQRARSPDAGVNVATREFSLYQLDQAVGYGFSTLAPRPGSEVALRMASEDAIEIDPTYAGEIAKHTRPAYSTFQEAILCERYGIGSAAALATVKRYATPEERRAYLQHAFADRLGADHVGVVLDMLASKEPARWKVHQAAGRKLRELTGGAFAPLKTLVEQLDQAATEVHLFET